MRGRTNINSVKSSSAGSIEINGNIETYSIADNNVINEGDFVSIYKDASPITNAIQLVSGSKNDDVGYLSYIGNYMENEFYYMTSKLFNNFRFLVCYSGYGDILFVTNILSPINGDKISINEIKIVGKYIVFVSKTYRNNNDYIQFFLYSIDINNKRIEKICEYDTNIETYDNIPPCVCCIDDTRFLVGLYNYTNGNNTIIMYQINEGLDEVSFEMLDKINVAGTICPVFEKIGNKIIVLNGGLNCTVIELEENSLKKIIENKVGSSYLYYITSTVIIGEDIIVCDTNSAKLYAIDTFNGVIKSEYKIENTNSISYKDGILYGVISSGAVYDSLYITVMRYDNGVFTEIKNIELFAISEIKIESATAKKCAYLIFINDRPKLIMYFYRYYNSNSYMRYFVEMDVKKIGYDFVFGGDYVKQYDGSSALGIAKTGGESGDTIEVYVPQ